MRGIVGMDHRHRVNDCVAAGGGPRREITVSRISHVSGLRTVSFRGKIQGLDAVPLREGIGERSP